MVVGSQRCDWMRSDAQVGCLVCALPREHTKLPESTPNCQRPYAKSCTEAGAAAMKRTPRPRHGPVGPRYDSDRATGQRTT